MSVELILIFAIFAVICVVCIGNQQLAVVTLLSGSGNGFVSGAVALGQSLLDHRKHEKLKFVRLALVTPDVDTDSRESLTKNKLWQVQEIPYIQCNAIDLVDPIFTVEKTLSWASTCTKFAVWGLTQYDRVVFMDADTLALSPISSIFYQHSNASLVAAPDVFPPDTFNSGVMVITPSQQTFEKLLQFNKEFGSVDGGDQSILNKRLCPHWFVSTEVNGDCGRLPWIYNVNVGSYNAYSIYQRKSNGSQPIIVHFSGDVKPWTLLMYEYAHDIQLQSLPAKHKNSLINQARIQWLWRDTFLRGSGQQQPKKVKYRLLGPIIEQLDQLEKEQQSARQR